jgi:hypothetical protein
VSECVHRDVHLFAYESAEIIYDAGDHEYLEWNSAYGYHVVEGTCMDCEKEFTPDELLGLGIKSVWKMKPSIVTQTAGHAKEYTRHPIYGRLTHYHRRTYFPTLWERIKRRLKIGRDRTQPST